VGHGVPMKIRQQTVSFSPKGGRSRDEGNASNLTQFTPAGLLDTALARDYFFLGKRPRRRPPCSVQKSSFCGTKAQPFGRAVECDPMRPVFPFHRERARDTQRRWRRDDDVLEKLMVAVDRGERKIPRKAPRIREIGVGPPKPRRPSPSP